MKVIGICGGNGVILHPMKRFLMANYEPRSLFKTPSDIQWKLNFPKIPLYTNQLDLFNHYSIRKPKEKPDIIVGAPDCGHSSVLAYSRAKQLSDPLKNESLNLYLRGVKLLKPSIFLMENLPKLLELVPESVFEETFPEYDIIYLKGPVTLWGNSQKNRVRLVMIGINREYFGDILYDIRDHFSNVYKVKEIKTCEELLTGISEKQDGHIREPLSSIITLYAGYKVSLRDIQDYWCNNMDLRRYPVTDRRFSTAPGVYRNLDKDLPATARKANRQFNSRGLQMSPRELARIQGVPDRFKIYTDKAKLTYTINKGRTTVTKTPPYEIGKWFYKQLREIKYLWK